MIWLRFFFIFSLKEVLVQGRGLFLFALPFIRHLHRPMNDLLHQEALQHFQNILRLNTVNPPGNESRVIEYLAHVLQKEGIDFQVLESAPGRANLVARLKASQKEAEPLLLSSHVDVVPAGDEKKWKYPPFEGQVEEGCVWGRGAIDMKHMVVYCLMTFLEAKRKKLSFKRDIIWAAVADEEAGGDYGSKFLATQHPDLIRAEYALNEAGAFTIHSGHKRFYPIQIGEKGFVWFRIKAFSEGGHGSLPHGPQGTNSIIHIAEVIQKLHRKYLPRHAHPVAESFILSLASGLAFPASLFLKGITRPAYGDLFLKLLPDREAARFFIAILHNTACPTMLEGGQKINVIPSEAAVLVDGRVLPGSSREEFLGEVQTLIGPQYTIEVLKESAGVETSSDTAAFRVLKNVLEEKDPGSEAIPYIIAGFTDATHYHKLGIKTYGFSPVKLPPEIIFSKLYHNHNERIPVEGFCWGLETFLEAVQRIAVMVD